jgi:hypothetical protein
MFHEGREMDVDKLRKADINLNVTWFYRVSDVQVLLYSSERQYFSSHTIDFIRTSISAICQFLHSLEKYSAPATPT